MSALRDGRISLPVRCAGHLTAGELQRAVMDAAHVGTQSEVGDAMAVHRQVAGCTVATDNDGEEVSPQTTLHRFRFRGGSQT